MNEKFSWHRLDKLLCFYILMINRKENITLHLFKIINKAIQNNIITVLDEDYHHIIKVLRKKIDDVIYFTDSSHIYETKIIKIQNKFLQCQIISKKGIEQKPSIDISVYIGLIQFSHFEMILNWATQLGIKRITPLHTDYSQNLMINANRLNRWKKIIEAACKQSFNASPPELSPLNSFKNTLNPHNSNILFHPYAGKTLKEVLIPLQQTPIHLFFGPEAGFSEEEIEWANEKNCSVVHLPYPILRTETALVSAISNIIFYYA